MDEANGNEAGVGAGTASMSRLNALAHPLLVGRQATAADGTTGGAAAGGASGGGASSRNRGGRQRGYRYLQAVSFFSTLLNLFVEISCCMCLNYLIKLGYTSAQPSSHIATLAWTFSYSRCSTTYWRTSRIHYILIPTE